MKTSSLLLSSLLLAAVHLGLPAVSADPPKLVEYALSPGFVAALSNSVLIGSIGTPVASASAAPGSGLVAGDVVPDGWADCLVVRPLICSPDLIVSCDVPGAGGASVTYLDPSTDPCAFQGGLRCNPPSGS